MSSGIVYPEYNDTCESVSAIKALLLGTQKDPWAILADESDWVKFGKAGAASKNSKHGTAFEGLRVGGPVDSDMDLFHICRCATCKFSAAHSRNSEYLRSNQVARETLHVQNFAFSDKTDAVAPVINAHGPIEVARVIVAPRKLVSGVIVLVLGAILRIKHGLSNIDVGQAVSKAITFVLYGVMANVVSFVSAVENGVIWGVTKFYWEGYPGWALWVARLIVYCGPLWYYDCRLWVYRYWAPMGSHRKDSLPRRPSTVSELVSDADDKACQANRLYMAFPSKVTALCTTQCADDCCSPTPHPEGGPSSLQPSRLVSD